MLPGRGAGLVVIVALAVLVAAPVARAADPFVSNLPWPNLLPALPVPNTVQPHAVDNCPQPALACVQGLASRLQSQWQALDATCDHRAVMSLAYLRITQALAEDLARPTPRYFKDKVYMEDVISAFSNRYFQWFDNAAAGKPVPEAWRIAYDTMAHGDVTAAQEVMLFSNAHVQRDLPYAYAEMGLRTPSGASRKPDHDGVNDINIAVFDPIEDEIAQRYDPWMKTMDAKPSPLDEYGAMELVKAWREGAWRHAERLMNARTPAERKAVDADIESTAATWARAIAAPSMPGLRAQRDAYCRSR
jgi:hypothetical protein